MPRIPADAPYLAATNSPQWRGIGVDVPLNNLARLAAGVGYNTWNLRHNRLRTLDLSALRVHRWNEASKQMTLRWISVTNRNDLLMEEKREMSLWLVRKHAVLSHALSAGEILQIDILDAVLQINIPQLEQHLGIHWPKDNENADNSVSINHAESIRNLDQKELEERHAAILQRLDSPAVHRTYDHEAATGEGVRLARICQFAIDHCSDPRTFELCTQWHKDMAELIRRMRNHWTRDEKASLLSLLDRFEEVLQHLLQPPPAESVYAPAARQTENHTRAADLFIGLGLRIFEINPIFDFEEENPAHHQPAWLDEYWYRRLALPSVVPQRDRILSLEPDGHAEGPYSKLDVGLKCLDPAPPTDRQPMPSPSLSKGMMALKDLARLASGVSARAWKQRNQYPQKLDASARRAHRWHDIARAELAGYSTSEASIAKTSIYRWLSRKHAVLYRALHAGEILQIDVLDAVARRFKTPQQRAQALSLRKDMWKRDQEELQKRCAEIKRILDAPTVNRGPNLVARDKVDRQISWIWKNMLACCTCVSTVKVCNQWHFEMTDLNWRMRGNWTNIERNSLVSLLACFKKVLKQMLSTLPKGSVYVPAARQPVDHARAIELFNESAMRKVPFCASIGAKETVLETKLKPDPVSQRSDRSAYLGLSADPRRAAQYTSAQRTPARLWDDYKRMTGATYRPPAAVRRLVDWYQVAVQLIQRYSSVTKGYLLWSVKENLHLWVSRKRDVLQEARDCGEILQIDVLNAVLEINILKLEEHFVQEFNVSWLPNYTLDSMLRAECAQVASS
ncbi:hypothetical protein RHOSPDRAFT_26136 [Rhodotorula sp. JG-1b]|nr:hypothetical protein RHOSPDRAFT_26136 [Rhodotorula sp. JG-1b]